VCVVLVYYVGVEVSEVVDDVEDGVFVVGD